MDATTKDQLQAFLEAELSRLEAEIETIDREGYETLSEASGENNYRDHMADQGSATFSRELDMTLVENARDSLASVRSALERMEQGTYEQCERCGIEIGEERLRAIPTATLCISCKAAEESR